MVISRLDRLSSTLLCIIVFSVPLTVSHGDIMLTKLTLLWVFELIACGFILSASPSNWLILLRSPIVYAAAGLLACYAVSTALSVSPRLSLLGLETRYGGLLPLFGYVLLMLIVVVTYRGRPHQLAQLAWTSVGISAIVGSYIVLQMAGLDPLDWGGGGGNARINDAIGTLGNPNFAGGFIAMTLPFNLYALSTRSSVLTKMIVGAASGIELLALWGTGNRSGMLAVLVAGVVSVWVLVPQRRTRRLLTTLVGAGVGLGVAIVLLWQPGRMASPSTLVSRVEYWRVGARIVADNPLWGTGPDTFYAQYLPRRTAAELRRAPSELPDKPHNVFIEHATSAGVPALACFVVVLAIAGRDVRRRVRQLRAAGDVDVLFAVFAAVLAAYTTQGIFSIDQTPLVMMGWIALGGVICLTSPVAEYAIAPQRVCTERRVLQRVKRASGALLTAACVWLAILPLRAQIHSYNGRLDQAMDLNPLAASYPAREAALEFRLANASDEEREKRNHFERADSYYRKALRLQVGDIRFLRSLAEVNSVWARSIDPRRFVIAERWWKESLRVTNHSPSLQLEHRQAVAEMETAALRFEALAAARPDDPNSWNKAGWARFVTGDKDRARAYAERALRLDRSDDDATRLLGETN